MSFTLALFVVLLVDKLVPGTFLDRNMFIEMDDNRGQRIMRQLKKEGTYAGSNFDKSTDKKI